MWKSIVVESWVLFFTHIPKNKSLNSAFFIVHTEKNLRTTHGVYRKELYGGICDVAKQIDYYGAAEPPVRCGVSHLSGLTEPLLEIVI